MIKITLAHCGLRMHERLLRPRPSLTITTPLQPYPIRHQAGEHQPTFTLTHRLIYSLVPTSLGFRDTPELHALTFSMYFYQATTHSFEEHKNTRTPDHLRFGTLANPSFSYSLFFVMLNNPRLKLGLLSSKYLICYALSHSAQAHSSAFSAHSFTRVARLFSMMHYSHPMVKETLLRKNTNFDDGRRISTPLGQGSNCMGGIGTGVYD